MNITCVSIRAGFEGFGISSTGSRHCRQYILCAVGWVVVLLLLFLLKIWVLFACALTWSSARPASVPGWPRGVEVSLNCSIITIIRSPGQRPQTSPERGSVFPVLARVAALRDYLRLGLLALTSRFSGRLDARLLCVVLNHHIFTKIYLSGPIGPYR